MNAITFLKIDHREIEEIFDEIESTENRTERHKLVTQLRERLSLHMRLEETFFYPQFENRDGLRGLIDDAYDDHEDIRSHLQTIARTDTDADFDDQVDDTIDTVEAHVTMEETELFPAVERLCSAEELDQIGKRLESEAGSPFAESPGNRDQAA